jgi:hypothetical protein
MSKSSPKLQWVKVRLGEDFNWWVVETSDPIHWDVDGLGIIDPRQAAYLGDSLEALREYGFDPELFEGAFFAFRIHGKGEDKTVELRRVQESFLELNEDLFLLPDMLDEEKSPYADFLDSITRCRVKLLNDLIDLQEKLEVDEIEETIREEQNKDYMEGKAIHFFNEVSSILDFVPAGYELELDDDKAQGEGEIDIDLPDFEEDETLEEDETMKWDEEEDDFGAEETGEEEEEGEDEELEDDEDEERMRMKVMRTTTRMTRRRMRMLPVGVVPGRVDASSRQGKIRSAGAPSPECKTAPCKVGIETCAGGSGMPGARKSPAPFLDAPLDTIPRSATSCGRAGKVYWILRRRVPMDFEGPSSRPRETSRLAQPQRPSTSRIPLARELKPSERRMEESPSLKNPRMSFLRRSIRVTSGFHDSSSMPRCRF